MLKKFTDTSPSDGTAANSANIVTGLDAFESMQIVTVFQGATGDTLDICLQYCDDPDGSTWFDYARWQIAAAAASATLTYTVTRQKERLTGIATGMNNSPALAAGTIIGGEFGSKMRVRWIPGASTSAGAAQTIYFIGSPARRRV